MTLIEIVTLGRCAADLGIYPRKAESAMFASMQGDSKERASTEMLEWVHDGLDSVVAADVDDSHAVPVGAARLGVAFCAADVTEPVLVAPPDRDLDIVGDLHSVELHMRRLAVAD